MRAIRPRYDMGPPRLGKLRKGGAKRTVFSKKANRDVEIMGVDLDHFRFDAGGASIEKDFARIYGDEPNNIVILFPGEIDEVWSSGYETYDSRGNVKQRHNGEYPVCWMDNNGVKYAADHPDNPYAKYDNYIKVPMDKLPPIDPTAKQVGRLNFMVPFLGRDYGIVTFETHSINDILMIEDYLVRATSMFGSIQRVEGSDMGIPFVLSRGMRKISTPDTDRNGNVQSQKRVMREKSLVMLYVYPGWFNKIWVPKQQAFFGIQTNVVAMIEQRSVDPDTGEILGDVIEIDGLDLNEPDNVDEMYEEANFYPVPEAQEASAAPPEPVKQAPVKPQAPEKSQTGGGYDIEYIKGLIGNTLPPKWTEKADTVFASWDQEAFLVSVADKGQLKDWQRYFGGRGDMPAPAEVASAASALEDSKVPI